MESGGRERKITIKRRIERVGVNRRTHEKKIFELQGCLEGSEEGLIATQSADQRQKVMGVEDGKQACLD